MNDRFRLIFRWERGSTFYCVDSETGKRTSLQMKDRAAAKQIVFAEHLLIIEREKNPERKSFYQLCWHLGGSQSDVAHLNAEDIDWQNRTIAYARKKTGSLAIVHFGNEIEEVLRRLPTTGPLFPNL